MAVADFKQLKAWQKAMDLSVEVHRFSRQFPADETYGLRSQIRRAAVSVPSNIAEGQRRKTREEFRNRLRLALGSLREVETQAILARRFEYVSEKSVTPILELASEAGRIINGLYASLS